MNNDKTKKLVLNKVVICKLQETLSDDQLKAVVGGRLPTASCPASGSATTSGLAANGRGGVRLAGC